MSIFEHHRFEIWNQSQHPYQHDASEFRYMTGVLPGVTSMSGALDWIVAVLYPTPKASVATPAALPAGGNTIGDYRVVLDDGDTKSAGYRWEQREGDAVAKWYKIYDMDFGAGSILQQYISNAQELFIIKGGNNDLDSSGVAVAGTYSGQVIYGGTSANTNLTLRANSGDGVGASTGYIQADDLVRILVNGSASAPAFSNSTAKTGLYFSGESMLFSANQVAVGNYSSLGAWAIGPSGSAETHTINGSLNVVGVSGNLFTVSTTSVSALSPGNSTQASFIIAPPSGNNSYLSLIESGVANRWSIGSDAGSGTLNIRQGLVNGTLFGSVTSGGIFTFGGTNSAESHQINGRFTTFNYSAGNANSGGIVVQSTDAASTASSVVYIIANGGDSGIEFQTASGSNQKWVVGTDSTTQSFIIGRGTFPISGTNDFVISTTGLLAIGAPAGLGTSAGAYHSLSGSIVGQLGSSIFATVLASSGNTILDANIYRDGGGTEKAIRTATGYSHLELSRETSASSNVLRLRCNYQDAQTADAALVTSNEITPFAVTAEGGVKLAHSAGKIGFFGVTPVVRANAYTITNSSALRTYDVSTVTLTQLANTVATLSDDLKLYGLVQ